MARLASFGGQARPQLEIAGVKHRFALRFKPTHRAAENVAGGQQRDLPANALGLKGRRFAERQNVFLPRPTEPRLHERGGGRAQNDFAMLADVVAVGVTDEDAFHAVLWLARVEPQREFWKINSTVMKLKRQH